MKNTDRCGCLELLKSSVYERCNVITKQAYRSAPQRHQGNALEDIVRDVDSTRQERREGVAVSRKEKE